MFMIMCRNKYTFSILECIKIGQTRKFLKASRERFNTPTNFTVEMVILYVMRQ